MKYFKPAVLAVVCSLYLLGPLLSWAQFDLSYVFVTQASSPVQVTGVGSRRAPDGKDYFGVFFVRNEFNKPLVSVQLGWTVRDCGPAESSSLDCLGAKPLLRGVSAPLSTPLEPGEEKIYDTQVVQLDKLKAKLEARGADFQRAFVIEFGVIYARFVDETEWEYDIINQPDWLWKEGSLKPISRLSFGGGSYVLADQGECNQVCSLGRCRTSTYSSICCHDVFQCYSRCCSCECGLPGFTHARSRTLGPVGPPNRCVAADSSQR